MYFKVEADKHSQWQKVMVETVKILFITPKSLIENVRRGFFVFLTHVSKQTENRKILCAQCTLQTIYAEKICRKEQSELFCNVVNWIVVQI